MKKHPKILKADKRGQIVIPKEARNELGINEDTGFYAYIIPGEGLLLKQINPEPLDKTKAVDELKKYAEKLGLDPNNLNKALDDYETGGLKEL